MFQQYFYWQLVVTRMAPVCECGEGVSVLAGLEPEHGQTQSVGYSVASSCMAAAGPVPSHHQPTGPSGLVAHTPPRMRPTAACVDVKLLLVVFQQVCIAPAGQPGAPRHGTRR